MTRFRNPRGRAVALALLSTAALSITFVQGAGAAQRSASIDASSNRVGPNGKITLEGRFAAPKSADRTGSQSADRTQPVRIQFRAFGAKRWRDARQTKTGAKGRFSERLRVSRSGRFRALGSDGVATGTEKIRMKSKTRARIGRKDAKSGQKVSIKGRVAPGGPRRKVTVKVAGDKLRTWTNKRGRYKVRWKAKSTGTHKVTVKSRSDRIAAGSRAKAGRVTVYRPASASWYGPGLYGNRTACGQTLSPSTKGVAHKSLPCGTKLKLHLGSKTVRAKVIDRGPYVGDREFDLTERTKNELGFGSTGTIWVNR